MRIERPIGLSQLEKTSRAISKSLDRLSSGRRVSSPSDDTAAYSMGVNFEAQNRGLAQSIRQINQGLSALETADGAVTSLLDIVQRVREIAVQASNSTLSTNDRDALSAELHAHIEEFQRIVSSTTFNDLHLLDGSTAQFKLLLGENSESSLSIELEDASTSEIFARDIGTGSFSTSKTFGAEYVDLVDINGDGNLDFVGTLATLQIGFGNGDGTFEALKTTSLISPETPTGVAFGDLDGDGITDVINRLNGLYSQFRGHGDGTFSLVRTFAIGSDGNIKIADVDNDGASDLVFVDAGGINWATYLNDGQGQFTSATSGVTANDSGSYSQFMLNSAGDYSYDTFDLGDLNGDGLLDMVVANLGSTDVQVHYGDGRGDFSDSTTLSLAGSIDVQSVRIADMDSDGDNDIITSGSNGIRVASVDGTALTNDLSLFDLYNFDVGDFDRDGRLDLALQGGAVYRRTANGFSLTRSGSGFSGAGGVDFGDLNGDHVLDVVTGAIGSIVSGALLATTTRSSALPYVSVASSEKAQALLEIADNARDALVDILSSYSAIHGRLNSVISSNLLTQESLEEAKSKTLDVSLDTEVAELTRLQILQQAQIAVQAQSNLSMQVVLNLFR